MLSSRSTRWFLASVCSSLIAAGCATTTDTPSGETGAVSLNLELAPGVEINEVDWVLTSSGMDPMSGTINTSAPGATASVEVFGLPPGDDYNVALMATSEDGSVACGGDADFEVEVGETTPIMVMLNCKRPERLGGVRVNGKFNICADLAKVIVSPLQTSVGNDIDLFAAAVDAEGDTIKYVWSGMGGIIDDPNDPTTTYTCGTVGIHEITIAVTDDDMEYCVDSWTVPVRCVEGDVDLCEGVDCDDGNQCTADRCNPATGECINADVEDGTQCDLIGIGDGVCEAGECVEVDLCEGNDCSDGNECTLDLCDDETGNCSNPPVDDGTECNNGDGMCFEGQCRDIDRCENVICEPTLNDCTVGICNMDTGECDIVNVPDGTECDGGAGSCSAGECVDDNLCDGVDCTSDNDCVGDGTCDPADGECIPGDNLPEGEPCDLVATGDGLCSGQGACVECNGALDCGSTPQCFVPTCVDNACGEQTVPDGTECDLISTGDGVCEAGQCVEAPECISPGDCPDMVCSSKDCVAGACTYLPTDGASCEVEPGLPGTCDGMTCVGLCDGVVDCSSNDECVEDGTCDEQSGECIPGDNVPDDTPCSGGEGTCQGGNCEIVTAAVVCEQYNPAPAETGQNCDGSEGQVCICEKPEFLAVDCELLGNSAPIPLASSVQQLGVAFAGSPANILPQDAVVLPAALICSFIGAGFSEAIVDNSFAEATYTNADISSTQLSSFLDDGTAGDALVSPHLPVTFDFGAACGDNCVGGVCTSDGVTTCSLPTFTQDCPGVGTGPGINAPTFAGSGSIPPGPIPGQLVTLTPTAPGTVDIGLPYSGIALNLPAVGNPPLAAGCVGGACGSGGNLAPLCSPITRGTADSPRVMYDATCDKIAADAGTCEPFSFFSTLGDICKGAGIDAVADFNTPSQLPSCTEGICGLLTTPTDFFCTTPAAVTACCDQLNTDFPDATAAQLPQLPVN